jgi:uncharacterized damage-inducible protein DinB
MSSKILEGMLEHHRWANLELIQACILLDDAQLDADAGSGAMGTVRQTLAHLVEAEQGYVLDLTDPGQISAWDTPPAMVEIYALAERSGTALLTIARDSSFAPEARFEKAGYILEPWLVIVQALIHAGEHREQVKTMLTAAGLTPPRIDGWAYGSLVGALEEIAH